MNKKTVVAAVMGATALATAAGLWAVLRRRRQRPRRLPYALSNYRDLGVDEGTGLIIDEGSEVVDWLALSPQEAKAIFSDLISAIRRRRVQQPPSQVPIGSYADGSPIMWHFFEEPPPREPEPRFQAQRPEPRRMGKSNLLQAWGMGNAPDPDRL